MATLQIQQHLNPTKSNANFQRLVDDDNEESTNGCNLPHDQDDKRANTLLRYGYCVIYICLISYLILLLPSYYDPAQNQITSTAIEPVEYYPFPFFYFYIDNSYDLKYKYANMSIVNISIHLSNKLNGYELTPNGLYLNELIYPEIKTVDRTFNYESINKSSTKWVAYNITLLAGMSLSISDNIFLVIPPLKANNIPKLQKIAIVFKTNGAFPTDQQTVLWAADSLELLATKGVIDNAEVGVGNGWGLNWQKFNMKMHTSALDMLYGQRVYLDFFERVNEMDGISEHYYKSTVENNYYFPHWIQEFRSWSNLLVPSVDYYYAVFSLNPWGGGVKTSMVTQQKDSFLDILAKVGGIFGIALTLVTFMFSNALVYGISVCDREIIPGFAKKVGLADRDKLKMKRFLREEGYQEK